MKTFLLFISIFISAILHSQELKLLGHIEIFPGEFITDVWGYTNPVTRNEYAIIGSFDEIGIIDISNPSSLRIVSSLKVPGFDIKVWQNFLYTVTGGEGINKGRIINISDPENPAVADSFNSAHNIFISENGYLFASFPGLTIYNLNHDPINPEFTWNDGTTSGHDAVLIDNLLYDFHGNDDTNIYLPNFAVSFTMQLLGKIDTSLIKYHHSGWTSEDGRYLFICDEAAVNLDPDITVWNIEDPKNPELVGQFVDPYATVHNLYVIGKYAFLSYYTAGLRILEVSDPANLKEAAHYDTSPDSGDGFSGAFGVYPFLSSGKILVSDQTGLYVFKFDSITTGVGNSKQSTINFNLYQNYPNPFNPSTVISYQLSIDSQVKIIIYDILGNEVAILVNQEKPAGNYKVEWIAEEFASGVYLYQIKAGNFTKTRKMILLR